MLNLFIPLSPELRGFDTSKSDKFLSFKYLGVQAVITEAVKTLY